MPMPQVMKVEFILSACTFPAETHSGFGQTIQEIVFDPDIAATVPALSDQTVSLRR
jgi:hypothetical protein